MNSPQEIAIQLSKIDFLLSQTDCPYENHKLSSIVSEIDQMDRIEAVRLMLAVIELKDIQLTLGSDINKGTFKNLSEFPYIRSLV